MTKKNKTIIGVSAILVGWLLDGLSFSTPLGHPMVNNIGLLLGIGLFIGGIIFLIVMPVKRGQRGTDAQQKI